MNFNPTLSANEPVKMRWNSGKLEFCMGIGKPWIGYRQSPYYVADYGMPNGSPGYATMQNALKQGVVYERKESAE